MKNIFIQTKKTNLYGETIEYDTKKVTPEEIKYSSFESYMNETMELERSKSTKNINLKYCLNNLNKSK